MNDKIQSDKPSNEEHQKTERDSDSMAQKNGTSRTDASKTTKQSEKTPSSYIRWSLLFEGVLVAATCATVGVAYSQWKVMERQTKIMSEQMVAMSDQTKTAIQQVKIANDAMEDNRKSGIEQTERAEKTLNATLENFRTEQRAWVGLKLIVNESMGFGEPFLQEGKKINAKIVVSNSGKSLARKVKISMTAQDVPAGIDPIKKQKTAISSNIGVMQPEFADYLAPPEYIATKSVIENIKSGHHVMYLAGRITYEDTFNRPHFTNFCMQLRPDLNGFTACPFYNEAN